MGAPGVVFFRDAYGRISREVVVKEGGAVSDSGVDVDFKGEGEGTSEEEEE